MGWDHSIGRQSVQSFLVELLGIDLDQVIRERLERAGLSVEQVEDVDNPEADLFDPAALRRITLSDGRTFTERLVERRFGDDWGADYYAFVPEGETPAVRRIWVDPESGEECDSPLPTGETPEIRGED